MKIGISSWTYTWNLGVAGFPQPKNPMNVFSLLDRAHELGVDVLQIADNLPLEAMSEDDLCLLANRAKELGISIETGTKGVRPEKILPFLKIAKMLGSDIVRTLVHDEKGCPSLEQAEQYLRDMLPTLKDLNLTLAIENHDFFAVKQLRDLVESIGDPHIRICLDPVNNLAQGESSNDVLLALGEYTVNFHCKDYTITRKPSNLGFDVVGCAVGDGLLNTPKWAEYFADKNMSFVVELWTPWQEDIEKTCELEDLWARKSMEFLHLLKANS